MLRAERWQAQLTVDRKNPEVARVDATVDPGSLKVRSASGGVLPMTPLDRREIHRATRREVLKVDAHPEVGFSSTGASGYRRRDGVEQLKVKGQLTLLGITRPVTLAVSAHADGVATVIEAEARIRPSRWGIRQYTAFLGALKVKDEVLVRVELRLRLTAG